MDEEPQKKAGRPPLDADKKRGVKFDIRFSVDEAERLDRYCKAKGWTRSQAIRYWLDMITI